MFRLSSGYINIDSASYPTLYRIATEVLTNALLNNLRAYRYYAQSNNDAVVLEEIINCMDSDLVNEIVSIAGEDFILKKAEQLMQCLKSEEVYTLDIFNEYLLLKMLTNMTVCFIEDSEPLKKELRSFVKDYFVPEDYLFDSLPLDKKTRANFYTKQTNRLYKLIVSPWKAISDEESEELGFLFWDYDCLDFEEKGFQETLWLYADTNIGAMRGYGKAYITELLATGGLDINTISSILDNSPYVEFDYNDNEEYDAYMLELEEFFENEENEKSKDDVHKGFLLGSAEDGIVSVEQLFPIDTTRIYFWIVSLEKNEELLKDRPYRKFMDLAVTYQYSISDTEPAFIPIDNNFLKDSSIFSPETTLDEASLFDYAYQNTPKLFPYVIKTSLEMMDEPVTAMDAALPMYLLFNENNTSINTTYLLLYNEILAKIADELDTDFFIMPSTISQLSIMPDVMGADFVRFVHMENNSHLPDKYRLTDNIYKYSRKDGMLSFVAYVHSS